jgi:C4-dicarboxylate transporter DctQ subunit
VEAFFRFNQHVMLAGKLLVGGIMTFSAILLFINVVLRYVFAIGLSWAEEVTRYILLWTVLIGAGVVSREGTHVSMEAFFNIWPQKLQRVGFLAINLFCLATIVMIFGFGLSLARMALETEQVSEAASMPMWLIYGAFPVGSVLMILGYTETAIRQWTHRRIGASEISFDLGRHDA